MKLRATSRGALKLTRISLSGIVVVVGEFTSLDDITVLSDDDALELSIGGVFL